jgi:hypothetical protein
VAKDFTEVTMTALKKKPKAIKCSNHRTISLTARTPKTVARILRRRTERKIEDIPGDQCGPGQRSWYSDLLRVGRSGDRIPVGGKVFHTHPDQTWCIPSQCTMCTRSFPGVKRPGHGVDHISPSSAEVKARVKLYLYSPSRPSWPV